MRSSLVPAFTFIDVSVSAAECRLNISFWYFLPQMFTASATWNAATVDGYRLPTAKVSKKAREVIIAAGYWHPEANDGVALSVYAFGEKRKDLAESRPCDPGARGYGNSRISAQRALGSGHCTCSSWTVKTPSRSSPALAWFWFATIGGNAAPETNAKRQRTTGSR